VIPPSMRGRDFFVFLVGQSLHLVRFARNTIGLECEL
jgi:hypothetical protein